LCWRDLNSISIKCNKFKSTIFASSRWNLISRITPNKGCAKRNKVKNLGLMILIIQIKTLLIRRKSLLNQAEISLQNILNISYKGLLYTLETLTLVIIILIFKIENCSLKITMSSGTNLMTLTSQDLIQKIFLSKLSGDRKDGDIIVIQEKK